MKKAASITDVSAIEASKVKMDYESFKRELSAMTLFDNRMMRCAFNGNVELVKLILKVILKKDFEIDKMVESEDAVSVEKCFKTAPSDRPLFMDVYARDSEGNRYNC